MGDFNLNWEDKLKRKILKIVADKFNLYQLIKGPTRIAKSSKTQLDLIFANKPERIIKSYNLITGRSDHNLTSVARKLTKNRFKNYTVTLTNVFHCIPKGKLVAFDEEIAELEWNDILSSKDIDYGCNTFYNKINSVREKFTVDVQKKIKHKNVLPWFNANLWKLMKSRDSALKKAISTGRDIDRLCYKGLRNKVIRELRVAKSNYYLHLMNEAKGNNKLIWKNITLFCERNQILEEMLNLKLRES